MTKKTLFTLFALVLTVSSAFAGQVAGPGYQIDRVAAHSSDVFYVDCWGGQPAHLVVAGDGDTDLDVFVYDENGNLIASDTGYSDYNVVTWTPIWTGSFRVVVRNLGSVYNQYEIAIN